MKILKLLGVLAIVLLLASHNSWRWWEWERNDLTVEVTGQWQLQHFEVELNPWHLIIRDQYGDIIFNNVRGERFINMSSQVISIDESRGLVSVDASLDWGFCEQLIERVDVNEQQTAVAINGKLDCFSEEYPYQITIVDLSRQQFEIELTGSNEANFLSLMFEMEKTEAAVGFGAQFTHVNARGLVVPVIVSEQGIGRGGEPLTTLIDIAAGAGGQWHSSYAPIPWFFSPMGRAMWLQQDEPSWFDFRVSNRGVISVAAKQLALKLYLGDNPKSLIDQFTEDTGRMQAPPAWVDNGLIAGIQGGETTWDKVATLQAADIPIAALWLQDWVGQRTTTFGSQLWWNWRLDSAHYDNWHTRRDGLRASGIHMLGYLNPFLVPSPSAIDDDDIWQRVREINGFVVDADGEPMEFANTSFSANMVELFDESVFNAYRDDLAEQIAGLGWSGWMADFAEAYPGPAGSDLSRHNRYPVLWSRFNQELATQLGLDEPLIWHRSASTGSAKTGATFWLGDQLADWDEHDGIKSAVTGLLTASLSGMSVNHSDVGGYTTIEHPTVSIHRSPELLKRWLELNAFGLILRTHEGNRPELNAQVYDENMLEHTRAMTEIFTLLAPYRRALYAEMELTGVPPLRHPLVEYPTIPRYWGLRFEQFFLGSDLLVVPVLSAGIDEVVAIIPPGEWRHWWTGDVYEGAERGRVVRVAAPLGKPAVFARVGGALD